jgi:hypothetical protein
MSECAAKFSFFTKPVGPALSLACALLTAGAAAAPYLSSSAAHKRIDIPIRVTEPDRLPFRTWWFADGLYVIKAHPDYRMLLGARVESLGAMTPERVLQALGAHVPETNERLRAIGTSYLESSQLLRTVGAQQGTQGMAVTFMLANGERQTLTLPAVVPEPQESRDTDPWQILVPSRAELPGRWHHVAEATELPNVYRDSEYFSSAWLGRDRNVLYARGNRLTGSDSSFDGKLFDLLESDAATRQVKFLILDFRFNSGGSPINAVLFAQTLPRLVPPDGKIVVLIGPATLAAAAEIASLLKVNGGDKVLLVGERMAGDKQFRTTGRTISVPVSRLRVAALTAGDSCYTGRCYWPGNDADNRAVSLDPDIKVAASFADYRAGKDRALYVALRLVD